MKKRVLNCLIATLVVLSMIIPYVSADEISDNTNGSVIIDQHKEFKNYILDNKDHMCIEDIISEYAQKNPNLNSESINDYDGNDGSTVIDELDFNDNITIFFYKDGTISVEELNVEYNNSYKQVSKTDIEEESISPRYIPYEEVSASVTSKKYSGSKVIATVNLSATFEYNESDSNCLNMDSSKSHNSTYISESYWATQESGDVSGGKSYAHAAAGFVLKSSNDDFLAECMLTCYPDGTVKKNKL